MKCPKCGKEIANGSQFCEFCGTQTKRGNKQVDIRWALLPAMLVVTFGIQWAWSVFTHCSVPFTLPAYVLIILTIILFLVSLWCSVRRQVAMSFVIMMGILLMFNCIMWVDLSSSYVLRMGIFLMPVAYFSLLFYIIYTFIAYKKGWTF
mgnify:CR=1 FL=1